jgi:hypothetical protein
MGQYERRIECPDTIRIYIRRIYIISQDELWNVVDAGDVALGSLADIVTIPSDVRFTPDNGHEAVHPPRHLAARL